jgi:hypothetical protein
MKTLFLFVAICAASLSISAQGNLQFNQVKLVNSLSTVPTNKVWKIESVLHGNNTQWALGSPTTDCLMSIKLNSSDVCISRLHTYATGTGLSNSAAASESSINCTNFPLWIPAGSTLNIGYNSIYISVIEYNIVP